MNNSSFPIHLIIFPISFIKCSIKEIKPPESISFAIQPLANINVIIFKLLE